MCVMLQDDDDDLDFDDAVDTKLDDVSSIVGRVERLKTDRHN